MKEIEIHGRHVAIRVFEPTHTTATAPWLLIHGAGHDHGVWLDIANALSAAGERVIVPELPAHGGSTGEPIADIEGMAAWVLKLVDALGLAQVRLCGHSMGSLVALAAAGAAPQRVAGLALVGSSVPMPVSPFLLDAARQDPDRAYALINKFSFAPADILGAERRAQLEAINLQRMQQQGARVLTSDLAACNAWQDGLAMATRVRCPTLLISGEFDRMTPADAVKPLFDSLEKAGCSARMIVLAGAGHSMMQEAPEALVDALRGM